MSGRTPTVAFLLRFMHCNDGVASHCETLIRALGEQGWNVVIISGHVHYDEQSKIRFEQIRSMVTHWEVIEGLNTMRPSLGHLRKCSAVMRRFGVSILHGHGFSALPCAAVLRWMTGVKSVATFHPSIHSTNPHQIVGLAQRQQQSLKYRLMLKATRPRALIATSYEIRDWLRNDVHVSRDWVKHIPLGIDSDTYRLPTQAERTDARASFGFAEDECVLLLAGRLSWNKGHDLLIDAARLVYAKRSDAKFRVVFAGSGDQADEIKAYANAEPWAAELFTFLGFVEDLASVYWASDVFVLPSRFEGFGLVVAEAMSAGLLPVRTPSGGVRDQIVEGESGFVTPFDDAKALARILEQVVVDRDMRARVAANAAARAHALFSKEGMARRTAALYDQVIHNVSEQADEAPAVDRERPGTVPNHP